MWNIIGKQNMDSTPTQVFVLFLFISERVHAQVWVGGERAECPLNREPWVGAQPRDLGSWSEPKTTWLSHSGAPHTEVLCFILKLLLSCIPFSLLTLKLLLALMEFWSLEAKVFAGTENHGPRKKQILNGLGKRPEDGECVSRERTRESLSY